MVDAANTATGDGSGRDGPIPDCVLMYACIFSYEKAKYRESVLAYRFESSRKSLLYRIKS